MKIEDVDIDGVSVRTGNGPAGLVRSIVRTCMLVGSDDVLKELPQKYQDEILFSDQGMETYRQTVNAWNHVGTAVMRNPNRKEPKLTVIYGRI